MNERLLTDNELSQFCEDDRTGNSGWDMEGILKVQDIKTAKLLIEEIENNLYKFDDFRLVITKNMWQ